jgi:A/G-specific adenine glycosylase
LISYFTWICAKSTGGFDVARDPLSDVPKFRKVLAKWFLECGKDYPWRRTQDPYEILVSEVMLQQTRIATVLEKGYYTCFLERFPDPGTLALADDDSLLRAWEGLGYYRRARMLRDAARAVTEHHNGTFPDEFDTLIALPGIGAYTAGALLSFAFDKPAPIVDGNVARVLARLFDFREPVDAGPGRRRIEDWAARLVDPKAPRVFNSAIMELGQTHCAPGRPDCTACPVSAFCTATDPVSLPIRKPRPRPTQVEEHAIFARRPDGSVLLERMVGGRREGFWRLPLRPVAALSRLRCIATSRYSITRYRVTLHIHEADPEALPADEPQDGGKTTERWHAPTDLAELPIAAPFRRALDSLLAKQHNPA